MHWRLRSGLVPGKRCISRALKSAAKHYRGCLSRQLFRHLLFLHSDEVILSRFADPSFFPLKSRASVAEVLQRSFIFAEWSC